MKLVDTPTEQGILEEILEDTKPPVPADCRHLHWLLFTPFRYAARHGSRFRRPGQTEGVFYAAERIDTSVAEIAFWRLLFFMESPATPWPANPLEMTGFSVRYDTNRCLELTAPPYNDRTAAWIDPVDYGACWAVADEARRLDCGAIRSTSARDPNGGNTVSILSCAAFVDRQPVQQRTWRLRLSPSGVSALCEAPAATLHFDRGAFASDTRVARFNWDRQIA